MIYQQSTQVPNVVFDKLLTSLTFGEFKILMVIIRQTYGWVDQRTGKRKTRDRISHYQFMQKTELSRRMISKTVDSLLSKGLIGVFDRSGKLLNFGSERAGRTHLYYSPTCAQNDTDLCTFRHQPVHSIAHNKTNFTKEKETKLRDQPGRRSYRVMSIGDVMRTSGYEMN
ncbi:MAG: replication protein [Ignavibacteria bacterium]|nr:replication protein [Ignavibacteria bacterium]